MTEKEQAFEEWRRAETARMKKAQLDLDRQTRKALKARAALAACLARTRARMPNR